MTHQYTIMKVSLCTSFFSIPLLGISLLGLSHEELSPIYPFLTILVGLTSLSLIVVLVGLVYTLTYWLIKGYGISNFWRSLWVTFAIRQYCHMVTQDALLIGNGHPKSSTNHITRRANRSLNTLNVCFRQNRAELTWHLPFNHESKERLISLFPNIKTQLNQLAKDYVFNDITNVKGNYYRATVGKTVPKSSQSPESLNLSETLVLA